MSNKKVTITKVGGMVKIKGLNPITSSEVNSLYYNTEEEIEKVTVGKTYVNVIPVFKHSLDNLYDELINKYNGSPNNTSKGTNIGGTAGALADLMV